uniref:ribosomal protein L14 n=1 Tax=Prosopanche panguanensis TaxID=2952649 RepID=UPI0021150611|nr:ribosomal protein L14 [Prosopanche panguanensis]USN93707.1 ribosomal protein L14 [Prosopanche panguanensis]
MINKQTYLNVTDNSGAIKLMCIQKLGTSQFKSAYIGDIVISVIKEALPNVSIEKSEIIRAVIVRTRKEIKRSDGLIFKFDDNAAVLIDKLKNPKGSRIFGIITQELRKLNFNKIISLSSEIL